MRLKSIILLSIILAATLCGAAAFLYLEDPSDDNDGGGEVPGDIPGGDEPETTVSGMDNDITYKLSGGTNSELNPAGYDNGTSVSLQAAYLDEDHLLYGWYLDPDFKNICNMITPDMTGNITLYAKWINTYEGLGFKLNVSGTSGTGLFAYTISGYEIYKYLYYSEEKDEYYMYNSYSYIYTRLFYSQTRSGESTYWPSGGTIWTSGEEQLIDTIYGKKLCEVWIGINAAGTSKQVQYIGDGWIPYLMTYESTAGTDKVSVTYTFEEKFTFAASDELNVMVYADYGVLVSGAGVYTPGDEVTLTASMSAGKTFKGWYDADGNLLSTGLSYTFEIMTIDVTVYAMNTDDPDHIFEAKSTQSLIPYIGMSVSSLTIRDADSDDIVYESKSSEYTFNTPGKFIILITGTYMGNDVLIYYTVVINGTTVQIFEWTFNGKNYTYSMDIDYSDVRYYRDIYGVNQRRYVSSSLTISFVTAGDPYIKKLAADLKDTAAKEGMTDIQIANFVLAFTQYIEYQLDEAYMGYTEYWKFPLETLFDAGGDCEDTSILYCAIVSAMGYKSALFLLPGHMASGIYIADVKGEGFGYKNAVEFYLFCETTGIGYTVGKNPDTTSFNENTVRLFEVAAVA
jgi:Listeria-Bacteroides repeat domain (List_Bact_rpt).